MILDLRDIFVTSGGKQPVSVSIDMSDLEISGYRPLQQPVEFTGQVTNRAGVVALTGSVNAVYQAPCDRCGVDATENISFDIAYTLVPSMESDEKDDFIVIPDYQLDLDNVIASDVILSLPTKHLCKADCMGICSGCGANLNTGGCSCQKEESAFGAALKKLLEEQ